MRQEDTLKKCRINERQISSETQLPQALGSALNIKTLRKMEKSINIHRALRTTLRLLLTSILSIVFGAVGVVVGLLAEIVAGILRTLWAIVLSVMMSPFAALQLAVNGAAMYVYRICDVFYRHILFQQYRNLCVEVN